MLDFYAGPVQDVVLRFFPGRCSVQDVAGPGACACRRQECTADWAARTFSTSFQRNDGRLMAWYNGTDLLQRVRLNTGRTGQTGYALVPCRGIRAAGAEKTLTHSRLDSGAILNASLATLYQCSRFVSQDEREPPWWASMKAQPQRGRSYLGRERRLHGECGVDGI